MFRVRVKNLKIEKGNEKVKLRRNSRTRREEAKKRACLKEKRKIRRRRRRRRGRNAFARKRKVRRWGKRRREGKNLEPRRGIMVIAQSLSLLLLLKLVVEKIRI